MDLHVEVRGHGPAVLWIHGYTMDATLWRPLWDLLPGFRHVGVDLPGHGRSGPLPVGETLPTLAARIAAIARREQAQRVVALSFGSCLALELAAADPGAVSALVLAAPTIAGAPAADGAGRREMQLSMLHRMAGPGPHMTQLWMTSPPDIFRGSESHPELRARLRDVIDAHGWTEMKTGAMRTLAGHVHTDDALRRISAATLVLVGDQDMPAFTANAARLAAVVPGCAVLTVPQAGHLCLLECPDAVANPLRAHLAAG
ncbi:MAG TPA: alpha/beta hydrolase [Streptosporangiaceae bacterium]|jgi:pimeloyl-ACP methyl ester carboxylesterase